MIRNNANGTVLYKKLGAHEREVQGDNEVRDTCLLLVPRKKIWITVTASKIENVHKKIRL